jgi:hypothetical protein
MTKSAAWCLARSCRLWHLRRMTPAVQLTLAAACAAVAVLCGWRGAQPPDPLRGPRLIPWRFLMVLAGAGAVLLLVSAVRGAVPDQ